MGLGEPPTAVCALEVVLNVGGGLGILLGVMLTGARMHHELFHHENLDERAMARWTKSALEINSGAVGPQR